MNKKLTTIVTAFTIFVLGFSLVSAQTSTDSADDSDPIRERVQEKIDQILSNPKAFLGSITDLTDTSIQIRNNSGAIEQISVDEETSYVKLDGTSEDIAQDDVAIGDYIIAMGYLNDEEVLDSTRILVTTQPEPLTRFTAYGIVQDLESGDFTLETSYGESYEIITTRFTDVFITTETEVVTGDILDIEDGDEIIMAGEVKDDEYEAYHIQIVKKAELPTEESEE